MIRGVSPGRQCTSPPPRCAREHELPRAIPIAGISGYSNRKSGPGRTGRHGRRREHGRLLARTKRRAPKCGAGHLGLAGRMFGFWSLSISLPSQCGLVTESETPRGAGLRAMRRMGLRRHPPIHMMRRMMGRVLETARQGERDGVASSHFRRRASLDATHRVAPGSRLVEKESYALVLSSGPHLDLLLHRVRDLCRVKARSSAWRHNGWHRVRGARARFCPRTRRCTRTRTRFRLRARSYWHQSPSSSSRCPSKAPRWS